jgi:hypothetical protein
MKLQELLSQFPRVQISNPLVQDHIFSLIDQTSITTDSLQISFERKPDFYSFLKAQGDQAFVFTFNNKDGSPQGFAASTFRSMRWNRQPICLGYTSDLRTTPQLDREGRLEWRKFYGSAIENSQKIEEFNSCIGFVTAVWSENKLAQKALVKKKRPGDFSYESVNSYTSYSIWGRKRPLPIPKTTIRLIEEHEIQILLQLLCGDQGLSWNEDDLVRTLSVFQKSYRDFYVLQENGIPKAFVLPAPSGIIKKTIIKKWPTYLKFASKLLPLFGKKPVQLNEPIDILQLLFFRSSEKDSNKYLISFIDYFWHKNNNKPRSEQFSVLSINYWKTANAPDLKIKKLGYLFTSIDGSLYKVMPENPSQAFIEMTDFSSLEIGLL